MSADNWTICPRCAMRPNPYYETLKETLREDYELGTRRDGEFYVSYRGRCESCGFEKVFEHSEQLKAQP